MISTLINTLTAPSETFKTISENYDFKQAVIPISLLMLFAVLSSAILSEQIADLQWEQIEQSINNNPNISEEQKQQILGSQYDRIYSNTGPGSIFIYISSAISWPMRLLFWSLFSMIIGNLALGKKIQFGKIVIVNSFAYLPSIVEYIIKTPIQYVSDNMMIFTGLGALGVGDQGSFINNFLSGVDIFALWRVYLTAVAFTFLYQKNITETFKATGFLWIASLLIFSAIGAFFAGLGG